MFIKIELKNNSNKNFYQDKGLSYSIYKNFSENPIEMIDEHFYYTNFEIQPIYLLNGEVKTERSYCVLKKKISFDFGKMDKYGAYYDINYFVLKPKEQTNSYILCYFKKDLEDVKIKGILLYNNSNQFLYYMD